MLKYIKKYLAPVYFGSAAAKFSQGKYADALPLFEKANKLDSTYKENNQYLSCLGRCYYYLGDYENSKHFLIKSFEYFQRSKSDIFFNNKIPLDDYLNMLKVLSAILIHYKNDDYAHKVNWELQRYS